MQNIFRLSQCDSQKRDLAESCSHLWPGHIQEKPVLVVTPACLLHSFHVGLPPPFSALSLQSLWFLVSAMIRGLLMSTVYEKELKAYKMKVKWSHQIIGTKP